MVVVRNSNFIVKLDGSSEGMHVSLVDLMQIYSSSIKFQTLL